MATDGSGNIVGTGKDGSGNLVKIPSLRVRTPVPTIPKKLKDEGFKQYLHEKEIDRLVFELNSYDVGTAEHSKAAKVLYKKLSASERDALVHLVENGPMPERTWFIDQDAKESLIKLGLVVAVCNKGRMSHCAATRNGHTVCRSR
jgi:hypothetical protein